MRCINWGARILIIGFTGGIGLAKTNLLMIKGASVLGVRAGEAVRKDPGLGEVRLKALLQWAEQGGLARMSRITCRSRNTPRRCGS